MRLVLDTNLLVSALLKPGSVPSRALAATWARGVVVLYDARIAGEYRDVLMRPKFKAIERSHIDGFFTLLEARGQQLEDVAAGARFTRDDE